jgi:hypothetical protein
MKYNPEDSSEHHTRRRENLKSHKLNLTHFGEKMLALIKMPLSASLNFILGHSQIFASVC